MSRGCGSQADTKKDGKKKKGQGMERPRLGAVCCHTRPCVFLLFLLFFGRQIRFSALVVWGVGKGKKNGVPVSQSVISHRQEL